MTPQLVRLPFQNLEVWGFWVDAENFALVVPYVVKPEVIAASRN